MKQKSSFQELVELVASHVELKGPDELAALHERLTTLRQVFDEDRDLLETVIRQVERVMKTRQPS